jgi:hypothetical protein
MYNNMLLFMAKISNLLYLGRNTHYNNNDIITV